MFDEGLETLTTRDQAGLEREVCLLLTMVGGLSPDRLAQELRLRREQHVVYLTKSLGALSGSYVSLDASRPWIVFWCLHGLALLGVEATSLETPSTEAIVEFLSQCQHPEGGFGGGPGQLAHTATTYAALAALVTVGGPGALGSIGRESLMAFLTRMCVEDGEGGMRVHEGGEVDIRACYTAVAAAALAGLDVGELGRRGRVAAYVAACQTWEGGLGGEPGNEAHGAYTYCGLACLALLGEAGRLDLRALAQWCVRQQGGVEGGFRGRTNKLVDGCYSFWQGALMPLLQRVWPETAAQGGVPRGPGLQGDAARAARAWAAAEAVLCDAPLGEVGADVQAENHLMWVAGERAARGHASAAPPADADAVRRAQEDVTVADSMAPEVFAQCAVHCSTRMEARDPHDTPVSTRRWADAAALQGWVLACCQLENGGLRDKPGKHRDQYHTCYCLSGLSQSQHHSGLCLGPETNALCRADPALNVVETKLAASKAFWAGRA